MRWLVCLFVLAIAGQASAATMTTSMSGTSFGSGHVGVESQTTHTLTVANAPGASGALDFTVTSNLADFVATPASGTLAAGDSAQIEITFTPASRGVRNATITVAGNDTNNPSDTFSVSGTGTSGNLVITQPATPPLDFGSIAVVGGTVQRTVTIANQAPGNEPLTVDLAIIAGAAEFSITPPTSFTLAVGDTRNVTLTFDPAVAGTRTGLLEVTSDDAFDPDESVALQGTGLGAHFTADPLAIDFGTVPVGSFVERTLTITNAGNQSGSITAITSSSSLFALTHGSLPQTLAAGASAQIVARFTPVDGSIVTGSISLTVTGSSQAVQIPLTGDGLYEAVSIAATGEPDLSIDLGNVRVGVVATRTITVTSSGETVVTVAAPTSSAVTCTVHAVAPTTFPAALEPGEVATFEVRVMPSAVGAGACTVAVTTDIPTTDTIELAWQGVAPEVALALPANGAINFGVVDVDAELVIRTVVLDNPGTAPLAIGPCTITGSVRFVMVTACTALTVAPGGSATLMVAFDPEVEAIESATLTITVDALSTSQVVVALSGIGADQRLDLSALSLAFPDTSIHATSPPIRYIDIHNPVNPVTGVTQTLHIASATTGDPVFTLANEGPFFVEADTTIRLAVTFRPTEIKDYSGTLVIVSDASLAPMAEIALHGRGISASGAEAGGCCESGRRSSAPLAAVVLLLVCRRRARRHRT